MVPTLAARGFHVYALDLLGYGRSSHPDVDYSIALEEKTVVDFMHALNLQHADVAGWSMGGWIALRVAADHPAMVDRLVVYDSAGIYFPPTFDSTLFTPYDSAGLHRLTSMLSPSPRIMPAFVQRAALRKLHSSAWVMSRSLASMTAGHDLLDFHLHKIPSPRPHRLGQAGHPHPPIRRRETMHRNIRGSALLLIDGLRPPGPRRMHQARPRRHRQVPPRQHPHPRRRTHRSRPVAHLNFLPLIRPNCLSFAPFRCTPLASFASFFFACSRLLPPLKSPTLPQPHKPQHPVHIRP